MRDTLALTPPMGWNSFDCFGAAVVEDEVKANADYMASYLVAHGWEYIVVDFCWSHPSPGSLPNPNQGEELIPRLVMDGNGRLLPAPERFPSAGGAKGFKPLADYVHAKGLKFGIHIMRGIPRQAVADNVRILGTSASAAEIADKDDACQWLDHMYGVDMSKEGAQEYYDSLFRLYAEWGVDYVKADDFLAGGAGKYHAPEIEAVRKAADKCGRPMVLSFSPGAAPLSQAGHLRQNANLWRISGDFWDDWSAIREQFDLCRDWAPHSGPGHWADADMIPFGRLSKRGPYGPERFSNFTADEEVTLMTLWCISRSPLMFGGNMPENDGFVLSLLTNDEVLAVNRNSSRNREYFRRGDLICWTADAPESKGMYVALFNTGDNLQAATIVLEELGLGGKCLVRDLGGRKDLGKFDADFTVKIPSHGAGLYRVSRL